MDFWTWRYLRPGGSRPAWPSTIFPTSLTWIPYAFWHGFGIDFGAFVHLLSIIWNRSFWQRSCLGILLNFHRSSGRSNPGTLNYYVGLFEKQRKSMFGFSINCVSDVQYIPASFWEPFCMFFRFSWRRNSDALFCGFWHQSGTRTAPKIPKWTKHLWTIENWVLQYSSVCPDSMLVPFWFQFGCHLGRLWYLLVVLGISFGSLRHLLVSRLAWPPDFFLPTFYFDQLGTFGIEFAHYTSHNSQRICTFFKSAPAHYSAHFDLPKDQKIQRSKRSKDHKGQKSNK